MIAALTWPALIPQRVPRKSRGLTIDRGPNARLTCQQCVTSRIRLEAHFSFA